ncbi:MAG: hypothetical protein DRI57_27370 [Deltaproteobacteria bacterium]|nr:MAG: hypothetical protein DRI57_27370 [Deltaproteobacteria bacterium]
MLVPRLLPGNAGGQAAACRDIGSRKLSGKRFVSTSSTTGLRLPCPELVEGLVLVPRLLPGNAGGQAAACRWHRKPEALREAVRFDKLNDRFAITVP